MTRPSFRVALHVVCAEIADLVSDAIEQRAAPRTRVSTPARQSTVATEPSDTDISFAKREIKRLGWPVPSKRSP